MFSFKYNAGQRKQQSEVCRSHFTRSGHVRVPATGSTEQCSWHLESLCYSLCVCVSPKFIHPKPRPRCAGSWAVRMGSSRRTSALWEETAAGLLLCQATHKKSATHGQQEGPAEGERASTLTADFPAPSAVGNPSLRPHRSVCVLSQQPEWDEGPFSYPHSLQGAAPGVNFRLSLA